MHGTGETQPFLKFIFCNNFQGVLLVFEYAWFLLQKHENAGNHSAIIDVAIKTYQTSGTQAAVLNDLRSAIEEHCDNVDMLKDAIIEIVNDHRMCKSIPINAKHLESV